MWCLDQGDQQSNSDRAEAGNLSEKLISWMLLAFYQQLASCFSTDLCQGVELLLELLGTPTHARF
jgi:hypothetical protein